MKQFYYFKFTALVFLFSLLALNTNAQISIPNTTPVTENFDAMGTGTSLPSNWRIREKNGTITWGAGVTSTTQAAHSGSPTAGGTYNWGTSSSERAVGAMTSGSFASPNTLMAYYENTNSNDITALSVSYKLERYRINSANASVTFYYSTNGTSWTNVTAGDISTSDLPTGSSSYDFSPSGTPSSSNCGVITKSGINITGLNITNGSPIYLAWQLNTTGSNSQGIGIDDVSVTATFSSGSFHTVNFTGSSSDFDNSEKFSAAANNTDYYITFDQEYLYLGAFRTSGSFGSSDNFAAYIDTDPRSNPTGDGNGTTAGRNYNSVTPTLPFRADYTSYTEQSYTDPLYRYNGSWSSTGNTPTVYTSSTSREVRIALKDLGNPASVYITLWMGYSGGNFSNAPGTDVSASSTPTFTGFFGSFPIYKDGINPVTYRSQNTSTASGGGTAISDLTLSSSGNIAGDYGDITLSSSAVGTVSVTHASFTGSLTLNGTSTVALGTNSLSVGGRGVGGTAGQIVMDNTSATSINGTSTAGKVSFLGDGLIKGTNTARTFGTNSTVTIAGGVDFTSSVTNINGNLQINANGYVNTNAPTYGSSSTLIYNTGSSYTAGLEWKTNATSGQGVPNHVLIGNGVNTTLSFGSSSQYRFASGNVTISASSGLTLSSASGGDLKLGGNFTNNGTFTHNTRAVFLDGTAAQSLSGTLNGSGTTNFFPYLFIGNTSAAVSCGVSINVGTSSISSFTVPASGGVYQQTAGTFTLVSGALGTVNGIFRNSGATITNSGTMTIANGATYDHNMNGGSLGTCTWSAGSTCLITGTTNNAPGNLNQSFSDFTWNTAGMTTGVNLSGNLNGTNVGRDFNVVSTNGYVLGLTATSSLGLTIGRDLNISGGNLTVNTGTNSTSPSLTVTGNTNISGGALLVNSGSTSTGTVSYTSTVNLNISLSGSFTGNTGTNTGGGVSINVSGTLNNSSSAATSFALNASAKTSVTATITGLFTHSGTGNGYVQSAGTGTSTLNCNGGFTLSNGTFSVAKDCSSGTGNMNIADNKTITLSSGTFNIASATSGTVTGVLNVATNTPSPVATTGSLTLNGATLNISTGSGSGAVGTLNMYADLNLTSGNMAHTSGSSTVNFRGVGTSITTPHPQNVSQSTATVSGTIAFNVGVSGPSYTLLNLGSNVDFGSGSSTTVYSGSFLNFATNLLSGYNFTQNAGGNLITAHVDGINTIATGNVGSLRTTNTRTMHATDGQFIYNGTSAQVTGTAVTNAFALSVFNSSGVSLSVPLTIKGGGAVYLDLSGQHGKLYLGNNNLTLGASASIVGYSATDYIVTNGTGMLRQTVGGSTITFPVGNSAYNPLKLANSATSDVYGVSVVDGVSTPAAYDDTKLINRYWKVSENTAGGSTITVDAQYNTGEENVNFAAGVTLKMGLHNGTVWTTVGATSAGAGPYVVTNSSSFSPSVANYTLGVGKDDGFLNPSVTYTWNGAISNDWGLNTNWTPNGVPSISDNVIIPTAAGYTNELLVSGSRSATDFTVNGTGKFTMAGSSDLTIAGDFTYASTGLSSFNCTSTLNIVATTSQNIPALNYGNLNLTGGARVLANSGTIGICGSYTPGSSMTVTGSTINYNGYGAQTITATNYNNLTISNNRSGAAISEPAGTIEVAGVFDVSTLSSFTSSINSASIFDFTSASSQTIPAFFYGQLNNSGNGARTWASSGVIDIAQGFTPTTATNTITGSTVRYSNTDAVAWNLTNFTTNVANRHYNNLEIVGGASTTWKLVSGLNLGCTGNFSLTGAGTLTIATNSTANTMYVDGDLALSGTGNIIVSNNTNAGIVGTLTVTGNSTISNGALTCVGSLSNTTVQGNFNTNNLTISGSGVLGLDAASNTANASVVVNGNFSMTSTATNAVNFGSGTNNANNTIAIKGNFSKSGTGTIGLSGTYNATAIFRFNGTGTQTYSYAGAAQTGGGYTLEAGSTLQLLSNLTSASSSNANPINIAGTLDCQSYAVVGSNASNTFALNATGTLIINSASGIAGVVTSYTATPTFASGASFEFTGTNVNTGASGFTDIVFAKAYTITWKGSTSLTLDKSWNLNAFNFTNNGLVYMGNYDINIPSAAGGLTGSGFGVSKMFVTNGTGVLNRAVLNSGVGLPFTWPIGENTGTTEYSPVTVNGIAGAGINGTVGFRVVDGVHPSMSPAVSYVSRYWPITVTGFIAGYSLSNLTFTYTAGDIVVGPETSLKGNVYSPASGGYWTQLASSSAGSNVLTITSGVAGSFMPTPGTYDITGRIDVPVYYQSVATGNWSNVSTWEVSSDPTFVSPPGTTPAVAPTHLNSTGIFIRNGHTVTINSNTTADELVINSGGTLEVTNNSLTINSGTGTDMTIDAGGTFLMNSSSNNALIVNSSATVLVNGLMKQQGSGSPDVTFNGTVTVSSTGTYEHARNAGIIPTCTWQSGSTCLITGITNNAPSGLGQSFHHFTVNSTLGSSVNCSGNLQTINGDFSVTTNHASFGFRLTTNVSFTLNVAGDLIVNNGILDIASNGSATCVVNVTGNTTCTGANSQITKTGASTATWNFDGNFTQNSGRLEFNEGGSSNTTVNFKGDVVMNGTVQRTNGGTHTVNFIKPSGTQTWSFGGTSGSGLINWNVGNGTSTNIVKMLTNVALSSSAHVFTVLNGAILDCGPYVLSGTNTSFTINATGGIKSGNANGIYTPPTALGSIQTNSRNFPGTATYFYNGTFNQTTGNALPNTLVTTGNINIDNTGASGDNTVTLTNNNTTVPTFNLISGLFAAGTPQNLNITSGGTVNSTGGDFATGSTAGLLVFLGSGTFTGSCNPYNVDINGGVDFSSGTVTIQSGGTLKIKSGGYANTNAPAYASGSTLDYNTGGNYNRSIEWSSSSGKGYPHHVLVSSSTLIPAGSGGSYANTVFKTGGDLSISSGGNLYMDYGGNNMNVPLEISGDLNLIGNLSESGAMGGDINLKGHWNNNGSSTNFYPNGRAVTFSGTSNQNIGGSNTTVIPFAYLTINNAAGVTLTTNHVEVNNQLTLSSGNVTIGNYNLKLNGTNTPISGASSTRYIITNGSGKLSRKFDNNSTLYPIGPDGSTYSPVTLNQSGTADDIGVRVKTAPSFTYAVYDNNQMVNLEWIMDEGTAGGNNLESVFQWPLSSEAAGFVRGNGVFQGDYTGSNWQVRSSMVSGGNPYLSSSANNFIGNLSNRSFVLGNINGILSCVSTAASGTWGNPSTWDSGVVPPTSSRTCISHAVQISGGNTNAVGSVTLSSGGSLDIDATYYLVLEPNGVFTNSTGAGTTVTGAGGILFNGAGTFAGGNDITINSAELNGLTTISTPLTVNGNLQFNSGSSVSATPSYGSGSTIIYNTGGSYNVNVEWTGNSNTVGLGVPENISILNNTILNMPASDRGIAGNMNISAGELNMGSGDLYVNGNWTRHGSNGVFTPNNKAVFFNRGGTQIITVTGGGTETFNYLVLDKPSGSLVLNNSGDPTDVTINGSAGNTLQILGAGGLDINGNEVNLTNNGGDVLVSGGLRNIISTISGGRFNVSATKGVTSSLGGTLEFGSNVRVVLTSGMNFGSNLSTIKGILQIESGGYANTNAPIYAANSTLRYYSGNTYGRSVEWSATSGAGYPYHVEVEGNGTATTLDLYNGSSALRQMAGNLTLNDGGNLSMGSMTDALVVKGNVNIGGTVSGTLTLSSTTGGDIQIAGDLTRNTGGTFTQNGREVIMNGTTVQNISSNIGSFGYLKIDNTGSSVKINGNTQIDSRLYLSNGLYDLNGYSTTMGTGSQIRRGQSGATMSASPTVNVGDVVDMRYDGTMTTGVEFLQDLNKIRDLEISAGVLTLGEDKTINRDLILSGGDLDLSTYTFVDRGNATSPSFAGSITVSGGGTRTITGAVGSRFDITGVLGNSPLKYTKTVSSFGGTLLEFDDDVLVRIGDGSVDFGTGNPTTIKGVLQVMLGGSVGQLLNPCHYGTSSILRFANTVDYQVGVNDKTWAAGSIWSGNAGIPWNVEVNDNGTELELHDTRALRGNLTITDGSFELTSSFTGAFEIGGNWSRTGATSAYTHNNKKVNFNRQSAGNQQISVGGGVTSETYYDLEFSPQNGDMLLNGDVNVLNELTLTNGKVDLNSNTISIGTTGSDGVLTGGSSTEYFISGNAASKVIRYTTNTATTYSFPVGDNSNYSPISLYLNSGSMASNSYVSVNVIPSAHPNVGTSTNYLSRYWQVEPSNYPVSGVNYKVDYQWASADEATAPVLSNLKPFKYDAVGWIAALGSGANFEMGTGTINVGTKTISWDGLTNFSDFTGLGNGS
ncbi:MAG: hypothetical protein IT238_02940, partial [Bacteroidia bacterium]|nr:hypothetical protein [Bacteroidia bacterium]